MFHKNQAMKIHQPGWIIFGNTSVNSKAIFSEVLHTVVSIHVATTLTISRSFDKYFRSKTILHVMKFWDEANGLIEGDILIYLLHVK